MRYVLSRSLVCLLASFILLAITETAATARQGDIDRSFGKRGYISLPLSGSDRKGLLVDTAVQADGKIVALVETHKFQKGGYSREFARTLLIRLTKSGRLDRTFGDGGRVVNLLGRPEHELSSGLDVGPDGSIVVAGLVRMASSVRTPSVAMFDASGERVKRFGLGGVAQFSFVNPRPYGMEEHVAKVRFTEAGSILVAGSYVTIPAKAGAVAQLNHAGQLDPAFGDGGVVSVAPSTSFPTPRSSVSDLLILPDRSFLLVGSSQVHIDPQDPKDDGDRRTCLAAKYEANGIPSGSFGAGGQENWYYGETWYGTKGSANCTDAVRRSDGSLLLTSFSEPSGYKPEPYQDALLVEPNGTRRTMWPAPGRGYKFPDVPWETGKYEGDAWIKETVAGTAGSTYVAFGFETVELDKVRIGVVRLKEDGGRDVTFGANGITLVSRSFQQFNPATLDRQKGGKLLLGGITRAIKSKRGPALRFVRVLAR